MTGVELQRVGGDAAMSKLEELAGVYERVYAEPPYYSAPKFSRDRFLNRTREQAHRPGFAMVTARSAGSLVGFAFGFPMLPGSWWANASQPPDEVLIEAKFAVVELVVALEHRGHGTGGTLLDALLLHRPERYATLAVGLDADAYDWYLRRGWRKVGEFRAEPPHSDALVLDLRRDSQTTG